MKEEEEGMKVKAAEDPFISICDQGQKKKVRYLSPSYYALHRRIILSKVNPCLPQTSLTRCQRLSDAFLSMILNDRPKDDDCDVADDDEEETSQLCYLTTEQPHAPPNKTPASLLILSKTTCVECM